MSIIHPQPIHAIPWLDRAGMELGTNPTNNVFLPHIPADHEALQTCEKTNISSIPPYTLLKGVNFNHLHARRTRIITDPDSLPYYTTKIPTAGGTDVPFFDHAMYVLTWFLPAPAPPCSILHM